MARHYQWLITEHNDIFHRTWAVLRRWSGLAQPDYAPSDSFLIAGALLLAVALFGVTRNAGYMGVVLTSLAAPSGLIIYPGVILLGLGMKYFLRRQAGQTWKRLAISVIGALSLWGYLEVAIPFF